MPNVNSYGYSNGTGDLLVNVSVYIPETLNKDEKQALEKMQESDNFKPNTSIKEKYSRSSKTSSINFILQSVTERIPGFISAWHSL